MGRTVRAELRSVLNLYFKRGSTRRLVIFPRAVLTRCSVRSLLQIVGEPAEFIGNLRRTESEIPHTISSFAQEH